MSSIQPTNIFAACDEGVPDEFLALIPPSQPVQALDDAGGLSKEFLESVVSEPVVSVTLRQVPEDTIPPGDGPTSVLSKCTRKSLAKIDKECQNIPFPSLNEVIEEYRNRTWNPNLCWFETVIGGYERSDPEKDTNRLLLVAKKYLETFCGCFKFLSSDDSGLVQAVRVERKGYIRADIHGDLVTTLGLLEHLKEIDLLDENYTCLPGVKLFFLGDYKDRGANDIEVLTLLLLLKLKNPDSVFLLQGNHEESGFLPTKDSSDADFFGYWYSIFSDLFKTFPVGMSCEGEEGRIYLGHGDFAPTVDLNGDFDWKAIPEAVKEFPTRKGNTAKQQEGIEKFQKLPPEALQGNMAIWGDVGKELQPNMRGAGYVINAEIIQSFLRANGFGAMFRGHQHVYKEEIVKGKKGEKVICTTLPVATAANVFKHAIGEQENQGILFEPHGKVRTWRKWIDRAHGTGPDITFKLDARPRAMYESCLV